MNNNFYKGIIFDLDGTLLNTIDDIANSVNKVLHIYDLPTHKTSKYKYFVGDGIDTLVYRILPNEKRNDNFINKIIDEVKTEYKKNWNKKTKDYPGILNLLKKCTKKKIKMAVLSNKPDKFTKIMVKKFFPKINFECVLGVKRDGIKKPNPIVALKIAKKFKLHPKEIIYLGDTNTDMQTANNSGMFAVGALWGFRSKNELIKNGAKIVIKKPQELFTKIF